MVPSPAPGADMQSTVSSQSFSGELLHPGWPCLVTSSRVSASCQRVWLWLRSDAGLQKPSSSFHGVFRAG